MLNDQEFNLGAYFIAQWQNRTVSSGNELETPVGKPDKTVTSADVLLTPNPVHVEAITGVDKIWGKPILFRNVPVQRFDLETTETSGRRVTAPPTDVGGLPLYDRTFVRLSG